MTRLPPVVALLLVACACSGTQSPGPSVADSAVTEGLVRRLTPQFSSLWSISYHEGYARLSLRAPLASWSGTGTDAAVTQDHLLLIPRGTTPVLPADVASWPRVNVPVRTLATNAESDEAFVSALGIDNRLVAVGGTQSWDDGIAARVRNGALAQVGYTWHQPPNLEVLVTRRPDVLLTRLVNLDHASSLSRARGLGIPVVPMFSWAEPTYLGDAEWILLVGILTGREDAAVAFFNTIVDGVQAAKARARQASARGRTKAIWAYYAGNQRWIVHNRGKEGAWLDDAGADDLALRLQLPWSDGGSPISTERLIAIAADADVWIIGDPHSVDDAGTQLPPEAVLQRVKAWRDRRLFHTYQQRKAERNAFAWYSIAALRPDLVLHDLVSALYPPAPQHPFEFLGAFTPPAR